MSKEEKYPLERAKERAQGIVNLLMVYCHKCEIAGSIRRERKEVGDIEIVCVPKTTEFPDGVFATKEVRVAGFIDIINRMEKVKGDPKEGKYTQRIHSSGIKVDFFIATKKNFGLIMMIRTGPAAYSHQMMTDIKPNYRSKDGSLQGYYQGEGFKDIPCYTEKDFYDITGQPYILPVARV